MSPRLPRVTGHDFVRALERDGWRFTRQAGSHQTYRHPDKPGRVVVPVHAGEDLPIGLIARLLRDAGITADDLRRLL
jgi:predicted RNA binding protein YcfA (HicA-like mRNA interferase family)